MIKKKREKKGRTWRKCRSSIESGTWSKERKEGRRKTRGARWGDSILSSPKGILDIGSSLGDGTVQWTGPHSEKHVEAITFRSILTLLPFHTFGEKVVAKRWKKRRGDMDQKVTTHATYFAACDPESIRLEESPTLPELLPSKERIGFLSQARRPPDVQKL